MIRQFRSSSVGVWLLPVFFILCCAVSASTLDRKAVAPFSVKNLAGDSVSLGQFNGKVVLVSFWATWCPPCVRELPSMQALKQSLAGQPFEILALNAGETAEDLNRFVKNFDTPLDFPILVDTSKSVATDWNIKAMPTSFLLDRWGRMAHKITGPRDWNDEDMRSLVTALLQE